MNWNAIIAVAEIIGVIAIIASLIYVAIQIRQNTSIARAGMVHDTSVAWGNYHQMLATDAELSGMYIRGVSGESLNPVEVLRFQSIVELYLTLLEDSDHQYKSDLYFDEEDDEDLIEYMAPMFKELFNSHIARRWWAEYGYESTTPSMHEKMSRIMQKWDEEDGVEANS